MEIIIIALSSFIVGILVGLKYSGKLSIGLKQNINITELPPSAFGSKENHPNWGEGSTKGYN